MGAVPAPAAGPLHQAGAMGNLRAAVQNLGCQAWAGGSRRRTESPHTAVRTRALTCTNLEPRDAGLGGKVHYLGDGCGKVRQGPAGVRPSRVALTRNSSSLWRNRAVSSPEGGRPQTMARFPRSCLTVRLVLGREAPHDAQQPGPLCPLRPREPQSDGRCHGHGHGARGSARPDSPGSPSRRLLLRKSTDSVLASDSALVVWPLPAGPGQLRVGQVRVLPLQSLGLLRPQGGLRGAGMG